MRIDIDGEMDRREEFGRALGRAWRDTALKGKTWREFLLILPVHIIDECDFIALHAAWEEMNRDDTP